MVLLYVNGRKPEKDNTIIGSIFLGNENKRFHRVREILFENVTRSKPSFLKKSGPVPLPSLAWDPTRVVEQCWSLKCWFHTRGSARLPDRSSDQRWVVHTTCTYYIVCLPDHVLTDEAGRLMSALMSRPLDTTALDGYRQGRTITPSISEKNDVSFSLHQQKTFLLFTSFSYIYLLLSNSHYLYSFAATCNDFELFFFIMIPYYNLCTSTKK